MDCAAEVKELRKNLGMNRREFCTYYEIPYRTVCDWEAGKRNMPEYLLRLMQYRAETERLHARTDSLTEEVPEPGQSGKELDNMIFLMFLISEGYRSRHSLSVPDFRCMDRGYKILSYVSEYPELFDSMTETEMQEEIEQYVAGA